MFLLPSLGIIPCFMRRVLSPSKCVNFRGFSSELENNSIVDPNDRSQPVDVETSIRYLKSKAYQKTYGNEVVWRYYRRNFKGGLAPKTRKRCIRGGKISTASPCPICRDEYLVVHFENTKLLEQFICPHGGHILQPEKTGVCQIKQRELTVEIKKAQNYGLLTFDVPHRSYNYSLYYEVDKEDPVKSTE